MWSLRGVYPVGRNLSSQLIPGPSPQPRCVRAFFAPAVAIAHRQEGNSISHRFYRNNIISTARSSLESISKMINNNAIKHPFHETRRCMSKYLSKSATKRLPLTTKRAKKGYYKGKGCTSEGRLTSKGKFIADPMKKLQLIVPDLTGFTLKPYIARTVAKSPPKNQASVAGP